MAAPPFYIMGIPTEELPGLGIVNIAGVRRLMMGEDTVVAEMAQLGLDKVRIEKEVLLKKLESNREKHKKEYKEALEGWKGEVILKMKEHLKLAQEKDEFNLEVHLDRPEDHTGNYDRVIALLTASIDKVVVISSHEFRMYHEDEWDWQRAHKLAIENYSSKM